MNASVRKVLVGSTLAALIGACGNSRESQEKVVLPGIGFDESRAECVLRSPYRQVGAGLDAPGRLEVEAPPVGRPGGPCGANTAFRVGAGLHDITGPVANTSGMGWEYPLQVFSGLHTRLFARAFVIGSPCNGRRVLFVSADIGLVWPALRHGVLQALGADPGLAAAYAADNVMISATHTHQGPAGYSHDDGGNIFHLGYDDLAYRTIVDGIVGAIRRAHANYEAHPQPASVKLAIGELLDTNINRSPEAFALNGADERREFLNARGEEIDTDKRFVQLSFVRRAGGRERALGVINWFGVHPTILGPNLSLVGSDHKGYASLGFERIMRTRYDAPAGSDTFVAAFAQTNEGDASPNLYVMERPFPDPTRGGGRDEYESNAISGTKQLAKALELFDQGRALAGPVDHRLFHVPISAIEVTDAAVLAGLRHPAALDAPVKRTCDGTLGVSFGAGAEDGPGPGHEGVACSDSPDVVALAAADLAAALNNDHVPATAWDMDIPSHLFAAAVLCQRDTLDPTGRDYSCQAEKPAFFPAGPDVLPLQIFRVGNVVIAGLPWEVTTMAGRRIRRDLLQVLAPVGVDTVVIAGLANDFVNYLTTREEYASQQYEGASTLYGPWTLAAVQQELRKLAASLRDGTPPPVGPPAPADRPPGLRRPPYVPSDLPGPTTGFGALVTDVPPTATAGDTVRAEFQAGHPRNDLRIGTSYVYAERLRADGAWEIVATDRDPELLFVWKPMTPSPVPIDPPFIGASTAEAVWTVPGNTPGGTYRLRHDGVAHLPGGQPQGYTGSSSPFTVAGPVGDCP